MTLGIQILKNIKLLHTKIYSNIEYQDEIFIKSSAQKVMSYYGFGRRFHDLQYFEVNFLLLLHIP